MKLLKKKPALFKDFLTNLFDSFNKVTLKEDIVCYIESVDNLDSTEFRMLSDIIKSNNTKSLSFLIDSSNKNTTCYISVSKNIISSYNAKNLSQELNKIFNGKGGGSDTFSNHLYKIAAEDIKASIEILK